MYKRSYERSKKQNRKSILKNIFKIIRIEVSVEVLCMVIVIYVENMDITPKIVQKGGKAEVEAVPQAESSGQRSENQDKRPH